MNAIRQTQQLNRRELENATPPSASWHADYRDTAWIYVGGLPLDLSEGDVVTVFSQFGSPTHLNLIRDRETGKSKGFGFLKYEDQRSCDLAVDNLTGADVLGRVLRVDHTRYKKKDDEDEDTYRIDRLEAEMERENQTVKRTSETEDDESEHERKRRKRRRVRDGVEKLAITENGEEEDPMKDYLGREKRESGGRDGERRHRHRERRHRDDSREDEDRKERTYRRHREERNAGEREDRKKHKQRRRSSYSGDSDSERAAERSARRENNDEERSRRRRVKSRSRSPKYENIRRRESSLEPTNNGKSSKPSRLKFKGDG